MPEPVERVTLIDVLESRLRADIVAGVYPLGTLLPPERKLAEDYGVTRASIKNTLVRLEQLGLIETRHGVGSRVRDFRSYGGTEVLPWLVGQMGVGLLPDVFEARRTIGALVARMAAERAKPEDAVELRVRLNEVESAQSAAEAHDAENEVHRAIARITGNQVFRFLANSLLNGYEPLRRTLDAAFDPEQTASALAPLVEAIAAGDPEAAETAALTYLRATESPMLDLLTVRPEEEDR